MVWRWLVSEESDDTAETNLNGFTQAAVSNGKENVPHFLEDFPSNWPRPNVALANQRRRPDVNRSNVALLCFWLIDDRCPTSFQC